MDNNINNVFTKFNNLVIFLYILWVVTPYFNRNISNLFVFILVFIFFILFICHVCTYKTKFSNIYIYIILWCLILTIQFLRVHNITSYGNYVSSLLFYLPVFFTYLVTSADNKQIKTYSNFLLLIFCLTMIITTSNIRILIYDSSVSKSMTGSVGSVMTEYYKTNLATLPTITFITLMIPILLYYYTFSSGFKKVFYFFLSLMIIIFVYLSGSFISLIVTLIEILIYTFLSKLNRSKRVTFAFFLIVFILVFFIFQYDLVDFIIKLSKNTNSIFYAERLIEIANFLSGNRYNGSFMHRLGYTKLSFASFIEQPLFGKGLIYNTNINHTRIGMHSQLIDNLGRHGLLGVMFFIIIFTKTINELYTFKSNSKNINYVVITSIISMLFYSLFNIFANPVLGFFIFFVLPIFIKKNNLININENKK